MIAASNRSLSKRSRAPGDNQPASGAGEWTWPKAAGALLMAGFAMLVHRALVPKPQNKSTTDTAGSDDTASDGGDCGSD